MTAPAAPEGVHGHGHPSTDDPPAPGTTTPEDAPDAPVDATEPGGEVPAEEGEPETFPRAYVENLRRENARYREQAANADAHAQRLHLELVRATGRLADPADLEYDPERLDDADKMAGDIDDLLARKPHLASRRPTGDIGQGQRGASGQPFSLLDALKARV